MKSLIIILILLPIISLSQIKVSGFFETGYIHERMTIHSKGGTMAQYIKDDAMYSNISFTARLKGFEVNQTMMNIFEYNTGRSCLPISIEYKTALAYNHNRFSLGLEHMCLHPIIALYSNGLNNQIKGSYDRIFIKVRFGEKAIY